VLLEGSGVYTELVRSRPWRLRAESSKVRPLIARHSQAPPQKPLFRVVGPRRRDNLLVCSPTTFTVLLGERCTGP
jgi:hypothetical protein